MPPIERIAPRLAHLMHRRPLRFGEATARIGAYVYGNLVVLGALLAMTPTTAVSVHGALTVLASDLAVCARIGLVGAAAERFRGSPSSRRLILVGVAIAGFAAVVAVAKVLLSGE